MGSLKNCGIVRGLLRSGNLFLHWQPFFLIGAPGRREVGKFCWSAPRSGGVAAHRAFVAMGEFAVRWDGWCSRGGGMSLKMGVSALGPRPPYPNVSNLPWC